MVAISLYKGNLHRAPDPFRQWLMPTPKISLKNFKTLLHRRSRKLSRLQSSNDTISNPNPNLDHSGREHQSAGYMKDIGNVVSPLKVNVEKLAGELANANDDENVKEGSMHFDDFLVVASGKLPENDFNAAVDGLQQKEQMKTTSEHTLVV